jgi:hypothetical protein
MASELSNLIENELKNKGFYQPEDNHNKKASKTPAPPPSPPPPHEDDEENQNANATTALMGKWSDAVPCFDSSLV